MNVRKVNLQDIQQLRSFFLAENNFQIRYHACHERGWSDSYLILDENIAVGYGSVKGKNELTNRDSIFEFFLMRPYRKRASEYFEQLIKISGATFIECQSNDLLLTNQFFEFADNIKSEVLLFEDKHPTQFESQGALFRKRLESDRVFDHRMEPVGDYVLELNESIIATGGFMLYYNSPFCDLYLEVDERFHRQGFGSYLVQELKREAYRQELRPAARCSIINNASRNTLLKAGMKVCASMLEGTIRKKK